MSQVDWPRVPEEWTFARSCARGFDLNAVTPQPQPEVCQLWIERHARLIEELEPGREEALVAYAAEQWVRTTGRDPWSGELRAEFTEWGEEGEMAAPVAEFADWQ